MRRPLLGIFMVWILGEIVAICLGLSLVPLTSLDRIMADRESASVTVYGEVTRFRRTSSGFSYELANCQVGLAGELFDTHHLLVFTDDLHELKIGYVVEMTGELSLFDVPTNPGQFDMRAYYRSVGIDYSLWEEGIEVIDDREYRFLQLLWEFRESMREELLDMAPEDESGVFLSIFLGDRSSMDADVRVMYQNGGIGHILAISGLHISLFGMALYRFLKRAGCPIGWNLLISSTFMAGYVWMTGGSASSIRAWIMFSVFLLAGVVGRTYDILSALSLAGILLLAQHPLLLFQSGFQLSFLAMVGVGAVYPLWEKWWSMKLWSKGGLESILSSDSGEKNRFLHYGKLCLTMPWVQGMLKAGTFSLAIQTLTLPVIAGSYYAVPIYSVILNLIVLPLTGLLLGTVATCAVLSELTMGPLWLLPALNFVAGILSGFRNILILIARAVLLWYELLCHLMDALPGSVMITGKPARWQILLYLAILFAGQGCIYLDLRRMEELKRRERIQKIHGRSSREAVGNALPRWIPEEILQKIRILISEEVFSVIRRYAYEGLRDLVDSWISQLPWRRVIPLWFLCLLLVLCHPPNRQVRITALDVGQGDCICIQIPGQGSTLIDGGSSSVKRVGTYRILPFLKSQGIGHLGAVFLTHADADHYSGLAEVLGDTTMRIDTLCLTEAAIQDPELQELRSIADRRHIRIRCLHPMDRWRWGRVEFLCLYPSTEACRNWEEDKNNTSLVLKMQMDSFTGVFTGDLAEDGEKLILCDSILREELEHVNLLKVGHHGSRFSSCDEFLEVLEPEIAWISCGRNNRYGHPHGEVLERLQKIESEIYRTDEGGAIQMIVKRKCTALYYSKKLCYN